MRLYRSILIVTSFILCGSSVFAQTYPTHGIKLVQAFAPGASSDTMLRIVADRLSTALGQPVTLEYKPGAGSLLGTDYAAKSAPDGYTLLASCSPAIAPGPLMRTKMPYDPMKDFVHIAMIGVAPQYIVVRSDSPAKTLQEFIALVKAKPGAINYASAGVGSAGYLAAEMLKKVAGLDMIHIPYKGAAPVITDFLGGRLDMIMSASAGELVRAGKARMLAVTSAKRTATFPNVPTVSEIVPGVQASVSFWGISAPARTPTVIVKRLEAALMPIITAPDVQARLIEPAVGMVPMPLNSEQFVEFIKHQNSAWMPLIKSNHITID